MHARRSPLPRPFAFFALLLLANARPANAAPSVTMSATYAHDALSLTIPYHAERSGDGELTVEILSPEDHVLGSASRSVRAQQGDGVWKEGLATAEPMPFSELIWQRVRFSFRYDGDAAPAFEQIRSISTILRRPVMHILGQKSYLAGAQAAVRILVSNASAEEGVPAEIAPSGTVRIELLAGEQKPRLLYTGHLDRRGTTEAGFRFPDGVSGAFQLRFVAETPLGTVESTQTIRVEEQAALLLTSEKPIYQPSQTIHLRALALDRAGKHAAAGKSLTFEMEDPRGNKVFRKSTTTDEFGVASAEFVLADEVNLGAYHVRAIIGNPDAAANTADLTLRVERYVLPKFRITVDFASVAGKPKRDYRPGDHVVGTVEANYFFGKPVSNAEVKIKASAMDVALYDAATAEGRTDAQGTYHFDLTLPRFFAGRKTTQGAAPVVIEATVKDSAGHAETRGEPITVSQSPLLITAIPEGGKLAPGLENEIFLVTSYPDGTPARTDLHVSAGETTWKVATDAAGIASVRMGPAQIKETLHVHADDGRGNRASSELTLDSRTGEDQILLRTTRAVYKPGDRMDISVLSTRQRGAAYIDLVRDGQTMLTRDVDLVNGHAELSLRATPEMCGTLDVHAYVFGGDAQLIADHRLLFLQPADELHVEATADADSYLPGGEARVHFHVTNARGEGVRAALGLEVVDQAVFALAEKQPGFAKVFFYLEQELMKPRYEIHSLSANEIVRPVHDEAPEPDAEARHDRVARVLFSAAETVNPHTLNDEAGRTLPQTAAADYNQRYQEAFIDYVRGLARKLSSSEENHRGENLPEQFKALRDEHGRTPTDAWGNELRIEHAPWYPRNQYFVVRSAGPDRQFDTADDMTVALKVHTGKLYSPRGSATVGWRVEHDRGPNNGMAEIQGNVADMTGAIVPGAEVRLRRLDNGRSREAVSKGDGVFLFGALPPGRYEVRIIAPGFEISSRTVVLAPRDRGILGVQLNVGAATESVTVEATGVNMLAEPAPMAQGEFVAGAAMGLRIPSAAPGGAIGGLFADKKARQQEQAQPADDAHVRSYFPEALYINPEIITDGNGAATVSIPLADSITTWRMAMFASTKNGALGSGTSTLKVFQDFFVDLDLPVTLTQGDRVSIPVAIYNYSTQKGNVALTLQPQDWFALDNDAGEKAIDVDAGHVGASQFTIEARRIGKFKLTIAARMHGASDRADTVVREIEVVPNGRQQEIVFNGRLNSTERQFIRFPANAIPDASKIFVRLYPGPLSQIIEGMDGILTMPGGCFEQTSSSTYPNVLALDYMKRTKKLTPEVHAKAEGYIANGYQRLLTFEVAGGGFSWFGNAPANKILTAYGLMEFHDMAEVYDVDPRLLDRTRDWLIAQQQPDGSWKPDTQFINEGATNRYNSDVLRITAYIAWAIESAEYHGPAIEKAKHYIDEHLGDHIDPYTLAVLANFAVDDDKSSAFAHRLLGMLADAVIQKGEFAWWNAEETSLYATGESAAVETTGLAVQALLKSGQHPDIARKALAWITTKKTGAGNWGTTQATIMALRALVLASQSAASDARGTVDVVLDGKTVETLNVTNENNDLLHQFVLPGVHADEDNLVELRFAGSGGMAYQIAGRYFVPWESLHGGEPLTIDVAYDRTRLAQNDVVSATATIRNNLDKTAHMIMVDLGIPPGFELLSEDLQGVVAKTADAKSGRLEKFSMTATQAILYFDSISARDTVKLQYRMRAKYPIRASNFASRVYEYYDPSVSAIARPAKFEVTAR